MPGMTEPYLREKFGHALSRLATGAGSLPERVRDAMSILVMFGPDDMPDKWSRDEFAKLLYLSTDREAEGIEGDLAATFERMSTEELQAVAASILEIDHHLIRRTDKMYADDQPVGNEAV